MKKYLSLLLTLFVVAGLTACGDNKTKQKLLGTKVQNGGPGNPGRTWTATDAAATSAKQCVNEVWSIACFGVMTSLPTAPSRSRYAAAMEAQSRATSLLPDADGYITLSMDGNDVKLKFMDALGSPLTGLFQNPANLQADIAAALSAPQVGVKFEKDTRYVQNISANLTVNQTGSPEFITGSITGSTPQGVSFQFLINVLSPIIYQGVAENAAFPVAGQVAFTTNDGLSSTLTFGANLGSQQFYCAGPVMQGGSPIGQIQLGFTGQAYTGQYTDATSGTSTPIE